jgi:hypothetical protein
MQTVSSRVTSILRSSFWNVQSTFKILSLDEGIKKCKKYFGHKLRVENSALEKIDPVEEEEVLQQALEIYNDGCELIQ